MSDRIPCINPRCRRTAPAAKCEPGAEIICGNCWRSLPPSLRARDKRLRRRERLALRLIAKRIARGAITADRVEAIQRHFEQLLGACWADIKRYFAAPEAPAGLEAFLQEVGL